MKRPQDWNEAEWLSTRNPFKLMLSLAGKTSERKYRLFTLAWAAHWTEYLRDDRSRRQSAWPGNLPTGLGMTRIWRL